MSTYINVCRFFDDRPYRPIIRDDGYFVIGNIVDSKWLHEREREGERERGREKW